MSPTGKLWGTRFKRSLQSFHLNNKIKPLGCLFSFYKRQHDDKYIGYDEPYREYRDYAPAYNFVNRDASFYAAAFIYVEHGIGARNGVTSVFRRALKLRLGLVVP